jgi:hypothetical protein
MTMTMGGRTQLAARGQEKEFDLYMAISCMAVAFLGFAPTYWLPIADGTFQARPIIHVHGLVFFIWTMFFVYQTWLATSGRIVRHRATGLIGISLATAMTIMGMLATINQMEVAASLGRPDAGKAFAIVPLASIGFFAIAIAIAIANTRRPDVHKRLMLLASISILDAPIARWFLTFLAPPGPPGPPPVAVDLGPALVTCILIVVAIVFDWRTRGRPHPVYLLGGAAFVALKLVQVPISATASWSSVASWMLALAG